MGSFETKSKFRSKLISAAVVLGIGQAVIGNLGVFPLWSKNYSPVREGKSLVSASLSADQMLFALAGFRELIAGILWVRADSFFETGNYDAILPIIRLVTMLDPHQIDVYATGMWHIGYNFTDEDQRSDRRYLPSAVALGTEGAEQNPNTYEMFFETSWLWYHKIEDNYPAAVRWMEEAHKRKDILPARRNLLSRLYERNGEVQKSLDLWYTLFDEATKNYEKDANHANYSLRTNRDTIEGNLDTLLVRMSQRGFFNQKNGGTATDYDTNPPFDVAFSAKVTVVGEKVLKITGTWNVLSIGSRIRCVLRDADYPDAIKGSVDWEAQAKSVNLDPPRDRTYMQEGLFVRNQRFDKKIDMSRDPTMYPMVGKNYVVEFYYNPRSAPAHIQDKFGWNGEGMTDHTASNMSTDARPGMKCLYVALPLTKEQLLLRGEWADKVPVVKTQNYIETEKSYSDDKVNQLDIPALGANQAPKK